MSIFDSFQDRCNSDGLDDSALPLDDECQEPRVPKYGIRLRRTFSRQCDEMLSASDWFMDATAQDTPDKCDRDDDEY